nr:RNA-directed DNA polymerase, eukaryota, reverse transcriptase zinc-binding domain protein [Tanacetum cinerariifolium]
MCYMVEVLKSNTKFFLTFISAANHGRDRKKFWKDLGMYKRMIENEDWIIIDHSPAILNCPGVVRKKLKSIRLANYITENEEFSDIVETGWKKNVNGHAMYQLLNRSKIHTVMGTDGLIHEKDQVGMQFVKHFESFLGSISDAEKMKEKDECLFNKIDDSDAERLESYWEK